MTYELEIIEPRAKRLLEELMSLNLIRFIKKQEPVTLTRDERLAGLAESVAEINADMRGEKQLPTIWEALAEMENEENLQTV